MEKVESNQFIYHIYNPNRISIAEFGNLVNECGHFLKSVSVDEFLNYLEENAERLGEPIANFLFATYVKEEGIDQTLNQRLSCEATVKTLDSLGFKWHSMDNVSKIF